MSQPKEKTDREKVLAWLKHINEADSACIASVIEQCSKDTSARVYFVNRFKEDCEK